MTSQLNTHTAHESAPQWRDTKRYLWLFGLVAPTSLLVILPIVWGFNQLGWTTTSQILFWIGPFLVYILLPSLDLKYGRDGHNPPDAVVEYLENDKYYRYCTYIFIPFQYASVIFGAYLFTATNLSWLGYSDGLSWPAKIGLALSVGVLGGTGINAAHEMGHKKESLERWFSKISLAQTCYGHFYIEHNRGHHVRVATPEDPASARFGESFWEFLPRSVFGGIRSALRIEAARIRRQGRSPWNPRTWLSNDVLNSWLMSVVLWSVLIGIYGSALIPFVIIQAVWGFSMLESVNYLEHYGLLREKTDTGRYERCAPQHSWNSDHLVTNLFLYHLQRHSDHHSNPTRRYQALRSVDQAPELPCGYATLIGVTYLPWLWRAMMDHRVLEHYNGDITKVNISPRHREKILSQYRTAS